MGSLLPAVAVVLLAFPAFASESQVPEAGPLPSIQQNASPGNSPVAPQTNRESKDAAYSRVMSQATDLYVDGKFDQAARQYEAATSLDPSSEQAMYWAGQALVYGRHPSDAIFYLESAQKLGADSVALHLALTAAYAGAARKAELDKQRELLHGWQHDGHHPGLEQRRTFLVETFYTHQWHVNVGEYFEPSQNDGYVWKFTVRDPSELVEKSFVLQRVGPRGGTAAGPDKYVLSIHASTAPDSPGDVVHIWPSLPEYLTVKAEVVKKLRFQFASH